MRLLSGSADLSLHCSPAASIVMLFLLPARFRVTKRPSLSFRETPSMSAMISLGDGNMPIATRQSTSVVVTASAVFRGRLSHPSDPGISRSSSLLCKIDSSRERQSGNSIKERMHRQGTREGMAPTVRCLLPRLWLTSSTGRWQRVGPSLQEHPNRQHKIFQGIAPTGSIYQPDHEMQSGTMPECRKEGTVDTNPFN